MPPNPPYTRTWIQNTPTGVPGTRVVYTSLLVTLSTYVYGLKEFFKANGMTVVASCSGAATALSDLIASPTQFQTRGATSATAQSWIILLDGNGGQLLIAYTGATDDVAYVAYSPGATFGTGVLTRPVATDEQTLSSSIAPTLIGTDTSGDRVWHAVITNDAKAYRWCVARSMEFAGRVFGVEDFTPVTYAVGVSVTPVCAWSNPVDNNLTAAQILNIGSVQFPRYVKITIPPNTYNVNTNLFRTTMAAAGTVGTLYFSDLGKAPELQGNVGYTPTRVILASVNTASNGLVGMMRDMWIGATSNALLTTVLGQPYDPALGWWLCGNLLWPNPSQRLPMMV